MADSGDSLFDAARFMVNWARENSEALVGLSVLAGLFWFLVQQLRPHMRFWSAMSLAAVVTGSLIYAGQFLIVPRYISSPQPRLRSAPAATPAILPVQENRPSQKVKGSAGATEPLSACEQTDMARRAPILALFRAWETLDVELYVAQWTPDAVQYYGHGRMRDLNGIIADRKATFARLDKVVVGQMNLTYLGKERGAEKYADDYALYYYFKDGRMRPDLNLQETYFVVCDEAEQRWKIELNDDQKR